MASLTLMCGPSGSGKSTYLSEKKNINSIVICPDDFRELMLGSFFFKNAEDFIWAIVKLNIRVFIEKQKYDVYLDATLLTKYFRKQFISLCKELNVPCHCVVFQVDKETCKKRNSNRMRVVPDEVIDRQFANFEPVTKEEGFESIEIIKC